MDVRVYTLIEATLYAQGAFVRMVVVVAVAWMDGTGRKDASCRARAVSPNAQCQSRIGKPGFTKRQVSPRMFFPSRQSHIYFPLVGAVIFESCLSLFLETRDSHPAGMSLVAIFCLICDCWNISITGLRSNRASMSKCHPGACVSRTTGMTRVKS